MTTRIRLMTHNIWNNDDNQPSWEEKGNDCSAEARVGGLLRVWRETQPDVIGCQEASARMADLLKEGLQNEGVNYTLIWGRYTPILYNASKLELVDSEFGTYPENIDGYEGIFNDGRTKSWNLGVFRVKESGKTFVFATTHLWWKQSPSDKLFSKGSAIQAYSDEAREYQLASLIDKAEFYRKRYECQAIVVGDMNTGYNSKAIQSALKRGYFHAHDVASEYSEESVGYHNCFPWGFETEYFDRPFELALDHILVSNDLGCAVKRFERYSPDYYFPISDHSAAYVDMEL